MVTSRNSAWRLVAGVLFLSATLTSHARQASQPAATMPTDAELHASLDALLAALGVHELDLGIDGLEQADAREKAIRNAIGKHSAEIRKRAMDNGAIASLPRDVITLRNLVSPRLSGRVLRVGAGGDYKDLTSIAPDLRAGDLIILGEGTFDLVSSRLVAKWADVALVGRGVNQTTLKIPRGASIRECSRLLIAGVRVDCLGDPLMSNNQGSGFVLADCELMNYNSGSGGSNAIYSGSGVVWIEGCLFDGAKGVSGGRGQFGNALDIRGSAKVIARRCQFVDNDRFDFGNDVVFLDRCTMLNQNRGRGVIPRSNQYWSRDCDAMLDPTFRTPQSVHRFTHATDDVEFIDFVVDPSKPMDDDSKQLSQTLQLHRRLPYWIGLIRHEDARIRGLAAQRVFELTGEQVNLPKDQPRNGERLADAGVLLEIEKEYARLMNWFDANRESLTWDEAAGRYRVNDKALEHPK